MPRSAAAVLVLVLLQWAAPARGQAPPRRPARAAASAPAPAATQPASLPASQPGSAPASQPGLRVVARPDGVAGLAPDGAERWRVRHAGLAAHATDHLVGPIRVAGRTLYAVRGDLLEVDPERGVVTARTRFPATIVDLQPTRGADGEAHLAVTVAYRGDFPRPASPDRVAIHFRPGDPAPGRMFWEGRAWLGAWTDARELVPGLTSDGANPASLPADARDRAITALREAAAHDRTNPFYPALLGVLLRGHGHGPETDRRFAQATTLPGAHWADLLRVASILEDADVRGPARHAYEQGLRRLEAAGVRPDRLRAAVAMMILMPPPRRALAAAFAAKDYARVDEIQARIARIFPGGEGAAPAWTRLAGWLREQGQPALAARWAERARRGGTVFAANPRRDLAAEVDARLPFLLGALFGTALIALVVGLRRGAAARGLGGWRSLVPLPRAADLGVILIPLAAALALDLGTADRVAAIGRYASAPVGLFDDAADAPDVERWTATRLEPSSARELLVQYAAEEARATQAGGRSTAPPLDFASIHAAIEDPGPLTTRLSRSVAGSVTSLLSLGTRPVGRLLGTVKGLGATAIAALVLFALGFLVTRAIPLLQALTWLIPGGPRSLSAAGGLVAALAAAGVCGNLYPAMLSQIAVPAFGTYYGLEAIMPTTPTAPPTAPAWVFLALGGALALHVWGVVRDLRAARARRNAPARHDAAE